MSPNSKKKMPAPLAALLAALGAAGEVVALEVPLNPFENFEQDVRIIHPRTYARIMQQDGEFSRDEQDLATTMFHRSGRDLFSSKVIGFAVDCTDAQFERLRSAFPEECRLAEIVRDREGRFHQFMDRVMGLDQFIRSSPVVGRRADAEAGRRVNPSDN